MDLNIDSETRLNVERILSEHDGKQGSLLSLLQLIQSEFNYLPPGSLPIVADRLNLPLSQIVSVAEFYGSFSLIPRGKHIVTFCLGTACHVRGAERILHEASHILGIDPGETTRDNNFTIETVRCLGACALAPVMMIDGVYHGKMTPKKLHSIMQPLLLDEEVGSWKSR
ncbi:MAG: NAD(P)H-dependent oxidoreductase subunit E [Desulfobacteraceae bacterium]